MEYTLTHVLAETEHFTVQAAIRNRDQRAVAIKFLKCDANQEVQMRFVREARILGRLDHPNIIKVVDQNFAHAPQYVVTPLYKSDLHAWLNNADHSNADFDRDLERIFASLLDAVEHAHIGGTTHRDLKLKNILINSPRDVALIDFNVATDSLSTEERLTRSGYPLGTPGCMAPEQAAGNVAVDHRADIFQLGHILYKLVGGVQGAPTLDLESISSKYRAIVDRCTRSRPADRYQDVSTLKSIFAAVREQNSLQSEINEINGFKFACAGASKRQAMRVLDLLEIYADDEDLIDKFFMEADPCAFALLDDADASRFGTLVRLWCDFFRTEIWPFPYTDAVARRAELLFAISTRPQPRADLLSALIELGNRHHRFFVWRTLRNMLSTIKDEGTAQSVIIAMSRFDKDDLDCVARMPDRYHPAIERRLRESSV